MFRLDLTSLSITKIPLGSIKADERFYKLILRQSSIFLLLAYFFFSVTTLISRQKGRFL